MAGPAPRDESILVTGGAGFIGSHLVAALLPSNDVAVYDSLAAGARHRVPESAELIESDLRDRDRLEDAVAGRDRVFHLAALVDVERSVDEPTESHEINVTGTIALLEAARRHDVPVIVASSAAIYGSPEEVPIPEAHRRQPRSPYGLEKLAVDHYTRLYHDLYGLDAVALRYFNVYGRGQTTGPYAGVITTFLEQARRGGPITIEGDGTQTRDFVHVSDIVRANLLAATTPAAVGRAFNIGTGTETTIADLAEIVARESDGEPPITNVDPRPGDIDRSAADITRARSVLDYEPTVDLEAGIQALFDGERPSSGRIGARDAE